MASCTASGTRRKWQGRRESNPRRPSSKPSASDHLAPVLVGEVGFEPTKMPVPKTGGLNRLPTPQESPDLRGCWCPVSRTPKCRPLDVPLPRPGSCRRRGTPPPPRVGALALLGSEAGIRTPIARTRTWSPTVRRPPKNGWGGGYRTHDNSGQSQAQSPDIAPECRRPRRAYTSRSSFGFSPRRARIRADRSGVRPAKPVAVAAREP